MRLRTCAVNRTSPILRLFARVHASPGVFTRARFGRRARARASLGRYAWLDREQKGEKERNWVNVISPTLSIPAIAI